MERHSALVIGAGQAGLSTSYYLKKSGIEHLVLDAEGHVGDTWRRRWDSLHLFTPGAWNGLPGMPHPGAASDFPSKDAMADVLAIYAERFDLPVIANRRVTALEQADGRYRLSTSAATYEADHVVVATGTHDRPRVPDLAKDLDSSITQLHSSQYQRPAQLQDGPVLVVGAGTSGVEISIEIAKAGHRTVLAGTSPRQVPRIARAGNGRLFWWFASNVLTIDTPIGRRAREGARSGAGPLIRTGVADVDRAGVERAPRVTGVQGGRPVLADARSMDVANIVWCTGYRPDFSWVHLPGFDGDVAPDHVRGVVSDRPGLYVIGLPFLYGLTSGLVGGVGRDAKHIVRHLSARLSAPSPEERTSADRVGA